MYFRLISCVSPQCFICKDILYMSKGNVYACLVWLHLFIAAQITEVLGSLAGQLGQSGQQKRNTASVVVLSFLSIAYILCAVYVSVHCYLCNCGKCRSCRKIVKESS